MCIYIYVYTPASCLGSRASVVRQQDAYAHGGRATGAHGGRATVIFLPNARLLLQRHRRSAGRWRLLLRLRSMLQHNSFADSRARRPHLFVGSEPLELAPPDQGHVLRQNPEAAAAREDASQAPTDSILVQGFVCIQVRLCERYRPAGRTATSITATIMGYVM